MKISGMRALSEATQHLRLKVPAPNYARDLVAKTLAQHGLASKLGATQADDAPLSQTNRGLGARARSKPAKSRKTLPFPDGATFAADEFSCVEGARRFLTYVPSTATEGLQGLVLMLHGCTQTPEDFAEGTQMNALAETHRLVVIYPHQARGENAQSCWNWFRRGDQRRGRGEPAILSGLASAVATKHSVPEGAIFAAGLSAGGAMAAILGETYPDIFSAIGVHSGLPVESAKDLPSAFAAMSGNPMPREAKEIGRSARTIVLHGTADSTVHPGNGHEIVRQVLQHGPSITLQTEDHGQTNGRGYSRNVTTDQSGLVLAELWEIAGLGHAWSGGSRSGSYTDPTGPNASAEMIRFFLE
jgi:poly(hydroxyalkanoate) depolymerase family esterase